MPEQPFTENPDSFSEHHLNVFKRMLWEAGLDLNQILTELNYPSDNLVTALNVADYLKIMSLSSLQLRDESLFLTTRKLLPGTNDFVLKNLRNSLSIKDALQNIANSYNIIHGGQYNRVDINDRYISYIIDDNKFPYSPEHNPHYINFTLEILLGYIHGIISSLLKVSLINKLVKIETKAQQSSLLTTSFSQSKILLSSQVFAIHYDISLLDLPLSIDSDNGLTSSQVFYQLQQELSKSKTQPLIIEQVNILLVKGSRSQEEVAVQLHQSVASLKRNLKAHNVSFKQLKETYLNHAAQQLLLQGISLDDIAIQLGFSDSRSFCRAFKGWNALTPSAFLKEKADI